MTLELLKEIVLDQTKDGLLEMFLSEQGMTTDKIGALLHTIETTFNNAIKVGK